MGRSPSTPRQVDPQYANGILPSVFQPATPKMRRGPFEGRRPSAIPIRNDQHLRFLKQCFLKSPPMLIILCYTPHVTHVYYWFDRVLANVGMRPSDTFLSRSGRLLASTVSKPSGAKEIRAAARYPQTLRLTAEANWHSS